MPHTMYEFAETPSREDFLRLASYLTASESEARTTPLLAPYREQIASRLCEMVRSGEPDQESRRRYQALRLFVR